MSCISKELIEDAAQTPIVDFVESQDLVTDAAVLQVSDGFFMDVICYWPALVGHFIYLLWVFNPLYLWLGYGVDSFLKEDGLDWIPIFVTLEGI